MKTRTIITRFIRFLAIFAYLLTNLYVVGMDVPEEIHDVGILEEQLQQENTAERRRLLQRALMAKRQHALKMVPHQEAEVGLSAPDIVERVIHYEKQKTASEYGDEPSDDPSLEERYRYTYSRYEAILQKHINHLKAQEDTFYTFEVAGNLSYLDSLEVMQKKIRDTFNELYRNGQIITEDEFNKLNKDNWVKQQREDLTRIWGANYLAKKFAENPQENRNKRVPRYLIVVKHLDNIDVEIALNEGHYGQCYPTLLTLKNGTIYAEKIREGEL